MEGSVTTVVTTDLATEDQALLDSEHPTERRHRNTREMDRVHEYPFVPKTGTFICVPYPTRLVSNSWHTSDGVLPTKVKGEVT